MSTLQQTIDDGWRELNLIGLGKSANTAQTTEGVRLLNQIYRFVLGFKAGESLLNWPLGNYERAAIDQIQATTLQLQNPPANARLVAVNESAITVNLPATAPYLSDGARMGIVDPYSRLAAYPVTLEGNGNTIQGAASLLINTNATNKTWLFRADLGSWMLLDNLDETDTNPFPEEYDQFFAMMLAIRLAPRAGVSISSATQAYFAEEQKKFVARYIQNAPLIPDNSLSWTSIQSYDQYYGWRYGSQASFNQGWGVWNGWNYPW